MVLLMVLAAYFLSTREREKSLRSSRVMLERVLLPKYFFQYPLTLKMESLQWVLPMDWPWASFSLT
jgi:hypothetical protein